MYRVILKSSLAASTLAATIMGFFTFSAQAVEVYFFKGAGDFSAINDKLHFSRGLERMADTMNSEGIHAEVRAFQSVDDALQTIRKRKPESVAFVGHSMGALASMSIAKQMKREGIRVSYMGLIDIPGPIGVAAKNVEWVENFYSLHPVYGRLTNVSSHPKAENIHVFGYIHTKMDDAPKVKSRILSAIRQIHASENIQPEPYQQTVSQPFAPVQSLTQSEPVYLPSVPASQSFENQPSTTGQSQTVRPITPNVDLTTTSSLPEPPQGLAKARNLPKWKKRLPNKHLRKVFER